MLLLSLLLLAVIVPGGDNEHALQGPTSFHLIQISTFANSTWTQNQGSGWLDDLQIHGWDSDSGTAIFLKPWSKGNFSDEELAELEELFRVYFIEFTREVQDIASELQFEYPFELQVSFGCLIHTGKALETFLNGAYQGLDFLSFQENSWKPSPGAGSRAENVCKVLNHYRIIKEVVQRLLTDTCPRFLAGILKAGKSELERQVRPEAWLSPGPSPGPGLLMLVCHASGFYPKPIWVMWMRGEQEQQGTQRSDVLPNADGTWYLQVSLDVEASEASGLSCRVRHSSLGGQDIVLHWGHHLSMNLISLAVIVPLMVLMILALWVRKHCWSTMDIVLGSVVVLAENLTMVTEFLLLGFSSLGDIQLVLFAVFLFLYFVILSGNVTIVSVIRLDKSLHTPMYFFLGILSTSETCYTFVILPKMLINLFSVARTISFNCCAIQMFFFLGFAITNCLLLGVMGYDRYAAICHPLHYPILMSWPVCGKLGALCGIGGFLASLTVVYLVFSLPFCSANKVNHYFCDISPVIRLACTNTDAHEFVIFICGVLVLVVPFLFICVSYICILRTILKIPSAEGRRKAFSTCASHLTVVIIHYGCASYIYLRPTANYVSNKDRLVTVTYTIVTPLLNPMVYSLRNKDVQVAIRKVLGKKGSLKLFD
ncbi:unnamed protein product [Rangifer tarandus platyrhynchus]|uniref:G-protein coupled receptors family 1 profile domain-containing protein n=2 Tax=Rangifer tarandus platyrhynchus TaxID=3082113 RepID=A0ABN8XPC5_RANTA|nr:unnamed protein product [Rangifer tarandus platyrhynchus]